jgi:hypothetical protein
MKMPPTYKPKFSLSVKYLKQIMTEDEFNSLLKKYVEKKKIYWEKNIRGK